MKKKKFFKTATPYFFILPWIVGFLVFTLGPLILSLIMSFFDWPLTGEKMFVGLGNYMEMFTKDDQVLKSLGISLRYAAIFVPLNLIMALFLAMLITQPLRGVKVYRTIFYIPAVISGVAVSIIWSWILNSDYGVLNYLLSLIGIEGPDWLVDPAWALFAVILASAFGVGTMMLIFYTDMKNISTEIYEAASLDGAGPARKFFSITLPMITPTLLFNLITSIISSFQQDAADRRRTIAVYLFLRSDDIQQCVQTSQDGICQRQCVGYVHYYPASDSPGIQVFLRMGVL